MKLHKSRGSSSSQSSRDEIKFSHSFLIIFFFLVASSVMAIFSFYNSMHLLNIGYVANEQQLMQPPPRHGGQEREKYKTMFDESIPEVKAIPDRLEKILLLAAGNEEKSASTATLDIDVDVFLKDVYKYKPPSNVSQQEGGVEEYCGSGPDFQKFFSMPSGIARSRENEDKIIYDTFFKNNIDVEGTYIELGAFDGLREANTFFFDKCLKWKGLLLEGNPVNYNKLVSNRPNAHLMNFAPSCIKWNDTVTFYTLPFTNAGMPGHAKGYEPDGKHNKNIPQMDVPCGPIGPVIEKVFPGKLQLPPRVNFFSLDVEGAEKLVLDTIDFSKVQIDIFMIEVFNKQCLPDMECEIRNQVRNKMINELGYEKHDNLVNSSDVYIHPNYKYNPLQNKKTVVRRGR